MREILTIWACLIGLAFAYSAKAQPIITESTNKSETTVKSPPPSAISPNITTINSKNCSTGVSGAVQTQILGISMGGTTRDLNCELVVLSESLYFQQMKAPATTLLCQNHKVWWAMWDAGVYCPIEGKFGINAKEYYESNTGLMPKRPKIE